MKKGPHNPTDNDCRGPPCGWLVRILISKICHRSVLGKNIQIVLPNDGFMAMNPIVEMTKKTRVDKHKLIMAYEIPSKELTYPILKALLKIIVLFPGGIC